MSEILARPAAASPTIAHATAFAACEPSPLLRHLAGETAEAVAAVWRAPQAPYLTAPAARRHLLGSRWPRAAR